MPEQESQALFGRLIDEVVNAKNVEAIDDLIGEQSLVRPTVATTEEGVRAA